MEIRNKQNRNIKKYMLLTLMLGGINVFGMDNQQLSELSGISAENEESAKKKQDQFSLYMLQTATLFQFVTESQKYMNNCDSNTSNDITKIINDFSNKNFIMDNIKKTIENVISYNTNEIIKKNNDKDNNKLNLYDNTIRYLDDNTTCFHNLSKIYIEILSTTKEVLSKKLTLKKKIDIHSMEQLRDLQKIILSILEYYFIVEKMIKNDNTITKKFENISDKIYNLFAKYNEFNAFVRSIEDYTKNKNNSIALQSNYLKYLKEKYHEEKNNFYNDYENIDKKEKEFYKWKIFFLEFRIKLIEKDINMIIEKDINIILNKLREIRDEIISKQQKELEAFQASKIKDRKENTEQQQMILEQEIQKLTQEKQQLIEELKNLKEELKNLKEELAAKKKEENKTQQNHYNAIIELSSCFTEQVKKLQNEQLHRQKEIEKKEQETENLKKENDALRQKNEGLEETINTLLERKEPEIEQHEKEINNLKEQHEKEINNLKKQHEKEINNLKKEVLKGMEKYVGLSTENKNLEKEKEVLEKKVLESHKELKADLVNKTKDIEELASNAMKVTKKHVTTIEEQKKKIEEQKQKIEEQERYILELEEKNKKL